MQVNKEEKQETNVLMKAMQNFFQRAANDPFYGIVAYRNFKRVDE